MCMCYIVSSFAQKQGCGKGDLENVALLADQLETSERTLAGRHRGVRSKGLGCTVTKLTMV